MLSTMMGDYSNFVKINEATLAFCEWSLPSIEACFKQWHRSKQQTLPPCQQTSTCPSFKKPSKKSGACQSCIDWGDAVKAECYPPGGDPQWRNIDAANLHRDHVEVARGFAFIIPSGQRHTSFDDFDIGGILKIMTGFKPYHQSDQCYVDKIKKVSDIRNSLSHMALKQKQISDADTTEYFRTIKDAATYLEGKHQCLKNDIFAVLHNIYKSDITIYRFRKAFRLLQQEFHQHKHELEQRLQSVERAGWITKWKLYQNLFTMLAKIYWSRGDTGRLGT